MMPDATERRRHLAPMDEVQQGNRISRHQRHARHVAFAAVRSASAKGTRVEMTDSLGECGTCSWCLRERRQAEGNQEREGDRDLHTAFHWRLHTASTGVAGPD